MPEQATRDNATQSDQGIKRLLIVDGNAPWVRSLFLAMPGDVDVQFLRVGQPRVFKQLSNSSWLKARQWQSIGINAKERWVIIPGWNRAPVLSSWLTRRAINATVNDPATTAVIFTLPFYAGTAEHLKKLRRFYYAHDPFEFYGWDKNRTRELENRLLNACDATFAISTTLRNDLLARTAHPVIYSPNAVSKEFVDSIRSADVRIPNDLADIRRPMVGCTGQINETYDWSMMKDLVARMPEVSFVFIGPIVAENPDDKTAIDQVLNGRPNVRWLGAKPHSELPAYLRVFDVCLNPLKPGPHADRRSPLRLYDYLATGKPVVSTAINEADAHENQIWIGRSADEIQQIIRSAINGERKVDPSIREQYVDRNTWQNRASKLLEIINAIKAH